MVVLFVKTLIHDSLQDDRIRNSISKDLVLHLVTEFPWLAKCLSSQTFRSLSKLRKGKFIHFPLNNPLCVRWQKGKAIAIP